MIDRLNTRHYSIEGQGFQASPLPGGLHVVATPLGNLADVTLRSLSVLAAADIVLCEDTRISSRLMNRFAISTPLKPYHDHNAASVRSAILSRLSEGAAIALISDAGMPLVSDPGFKLVRHCIEKGIPVDVIPGPSAPVTALALSGLPSDQFLFAGFLSPKQSGRRRQLKELASFHTTLIVFESANRLLASLKDIAEVMGPRQIAIAREMTKLHQEVLRGDANSLIEKITLRGTLKGELTLVIAPPTDSVNLSYAEVSERLSKLLEDYPASKAAALLAQETGQPKSAIYEMAVELKAGIE
jgi:16S rRNA (cytidine1402-2'-O)-methyltransferase